MRRLLAFGVGDLGRTLAILSIVIPPAPLLQGVPDQGGLEANQGSWLSCCLHHP